MASKIDTQVGTQNRLTHGARPVIKRVGRRGDISFSVVLDLGRDPQSGKRIRRWHSGYRTKRDAERARTELLHGLDRGTYVEPTTMTTGEFLQRWLDATKTNVAVRTHVRYTEICRRWMREFGHVPLRNLRPEQILAVRSKWETGPAHRGKALSPQSVLHQHRVLYSALDRAVRWGMLASNPCSRVDPPHVPRHQIATLDACQTRALLAVCDDDAEYGPLVATALLSGRRLSEVSGLRWSDVDLEKATASVRQAIQKINGKGLVVTELKTRGSVRTVSLSPMLVAVLRRQHARQGEQRLALGRAYSDAGLVFANADGSPLFPTTIRRHFAQLCKNAGVPAIRFHGLRHSHATLLLSEGVHPKIVSERLGHASIGITLDVYSDSPPNLHREAAVNRDAVFAERAHEQALESAV